MRRFWILCMFLIISSGCVIHTARAQELTDMETCECAWFDDHGQGHDCQCLDSDVQYFQEPTEVVYVETWPAIFIGWHVWYGGSPYYWYRDKYVRYHVYSYDSHRYWVHPHYWRHKPVRMYHHPRAWRKHHHRPLHYRSPKYHRRAKVHHRGHRKPYLKSHGKTRARVSAPSHRGHRSGQVKAKPHKRGKKKPAKRGGKRGHRRGGRRHR
jgi:hypothetical protein